ncbi:MAG: hypothetical protein IPK16_19850 [Anaerolineales bacterium]|nr:hypothetical protein [Anaerolineales bacterium]
MQLQVVCFQLWEKLNGPEGRWRTDTSDASRMITEADLPLDYIDQALTRFYEDAIADVLQNADVQATQITERQLREWFSKQLITEAGIRNTLLRNEETKRTGGLPNIAVDRLARHFLVRTELRAGGAWVELVHDRFVEPILDANRDWYAKQSPLLRAAQAWQDGGKQPAQLLLGPQLAALAGNLDGPQEPLVAEFVTASRAAADAEAERAAAEQRTKDLELARMRAREQTETANRLRQRLALLIVMGALAVVAAIVAGLAGYSATQERGNALAASTAISEQRVAALATGTAISHQFATADALRSTSDALREQSSGLLVTSEALRLTSEARAQEASAARNQAQSLADSLIVLLTAQAPTPSATLEPEALPAPPPLETPSATPPPPTPLATPPRLTPTPPALTATVLAQTPLPAEDTPVPGITSEPVTTAEAGDTPVTSTGYDALSPTPTMTPPPNLTADAALAALQEQLHYVEATRTAEKRVTDAVYAQLPTAARYSLNDIVTVATPTTARTTPGSSEDLDAPVAGVFQPEIGLVVLAGKEVDGAPWWQLGGIAPEQGAITGWVPEQAPDGSALIQPPGQLPDTDIPNPATGSYLRAPFDGAYAITQLFCDNAAFYSQFQTADAALKGSPRLDFGLPPGHATLSSACRHRHCHRH